MSTSDTFPHNYYAAEVAAPVNEDAHQTQSTRTSQETAETAETIHSRQDHDPRLDPSAAREGSIELSKREGMPTANPSAYEKYMGRLEKTAGAYWNNPYLVEKGELRQSGMLAARQGQNPT